MDDQDVLYQELKGELNSLATPVLDFAEQQVQKRGTFLPFGASLTADGGVEFHAATAGQGPMSTTEILPLVHQALRSAAARPGTKAVAVCEWVKITPPGAKQTDAVKVLVEHSRGLTVAFFLPMQKKLLGPWQSGGVRAVPAESEVGGWPT